MKYPLSIILGVLLVTTLGLEAQPTNAPGIRPQAPRNAAPGTQPEIAGLSIGGPVGVLTEQQRAFYLEGMKAIHPQVADLQVKLVAARQDMLTTSVTGKFDENAVRQKALVAARIEAEIAVLRAKVFSQVQPPLTPEQIERVKASEKVPTRALNRSSVQRPNQQVPAGGANQDENGLPPKK